jgi:hypothetical protein
LGIGVNIPTSFGLFYPMVNVRFNFMLGTDEERIVQRYYEPVSKADDPSVQSVDLADVNTILSIPRLTILFYPPF